MPGAGRSDQVEDQFPFLPAGCTVDLDRQSREIILENLSAAVRRSRWSTLVDDLKRELDGIRLAEFLTKHDHRLEDIYKQAIAQLDPAEARRAVIRRPRASTRSFERQTLARAKPCDARR